MQFYEEKILPKLIDHVCSAPAFMQLREPLIKPLKGIGLELGVGSGLNFQFYSSNIKKLYILEPSSPALDDAVKNGLRYDLPLQRIDYVQDYFLPLKSSSLDFVVTTWTLCTISNVLETLREVKRVLKPQGRYYFLEHGLSPDKGVAFCQNFLNPLQRYLGGGCNLNRDIFSLIEHSGMRLLERENFYMDAIKFGAYMYRGVAGQE